MSKDHLIKAIKATFVDLCYVIAALMVIFGALGIGIAIILLATFNVWFGIGLTVLVIVGALFALNLRDVKRHWK